MLALGSHLCAGRDAGGSYAEPREERESKLGSESGYGLGPRFRYRTPKLELQYRYAPDPGVDDTDDPPDWNVGPGYRLEPQLELDYGEPEEDAPVAPGVPDQEEEPVKPGYPVPRPTPRVPGHRPDVRPDTNVRPQTNPGYPSPGYRTTPR